MRARLRLGFASLFLTCLSLPVLANLVTTSYTGTLTGADDSLTGQIVLSLSGASTVTLQTWGFGGGTNAAGVNIQAGGFAPFVGVFSGTGDSAQIVDGSSDILSNYGGYSGCPPGSEATIGAASVCGDLHMSFDLGPGVYTVLLTNGTYLPNAVFGGGQLGDGFTDLSGGVFQTCVGLDCLDGSAKWALDIGVTGVTALAEPATPILGGLALLILYSQRRGNFGRRSS
ncbi:DVUA0089 family protein [Roseateles saccharophilus]|uniref:Secreted protein with PEP-CTERM sorting signal n=1 Tax=Roseateles saccharophilus TaxID=304 RepID=A0A4R3UIE4_ROSSA|nr:DVUA0089 family protein [Roseateles saccharophilus]MDG0834132.1 hypothetical protein [Roseateles saccharophilus]TCU91346.1 hypothetical protein EV671_102664 [Roseateles saccharophilus]